MRCGGGVFCDDGDAGGGCFASAVRMTARSHARKSLIMGVQAVFPVVSTHESISRNVSEHLLRLGSLGGGMIVTWKTIRRCRRESGHSLPSFQMDGRVARDGVHVISHHRSLMTNKFQINLKKAFDFGKVFMKMLKSNAGTHF